MFLTPYEQFFSLDYTLYAVSNIVLHSLDAVNNCCLFLYFNVGGLQKDPGKNVLTALESPGRKVLEFLSVRVWEPCVRCVDEVEGLARGGGFLFHV